MSFFFAGAPSELVARGITGGYFEISFQSPLDFGGGLITSYDVEVTLGAVVQTTSTTSLVGYVGGLTQRSTYV